MRRLLHAVVVTMVFGMLWTDQLVAQPRDQNNLKTASQEIFSRIDKRDIQALEELVSPHMEMFDSTYPFRVEGRKEFIEYLKSRFVLENLRISIRQPTVHVFGVVGVVNFYYSKDFVIDWTRQPDTMMEMKEEDALFLGEGPEETGRGTIVFLKENNTWKAVTIHLSLFP